MNYNCLGYNNCIINNRLHCNKNIKNIECEKTKQRKKIQYELSILANDYNSQKFRENPNYYKDVCKYYYNNSKYVFNNERGLIHKITNLNRIKQIQQNKYNKNIYSDHHKQAIYDKIYNTVYKSMLRGLPNIPQRYAMANRKTIEWIKRYANSQGTTNDGWPATTLIGTS
jgi:hypothetical protein